MGIGMKSLKWEGFGTKGMFPQDPHISSFTHECQT